MSQGDETTELRLQTDEKGLIPAIVTSALDNQVLMFAFMNQQALDLTLATRQLHLYSRSRQSIWKKGETSGEVFNVTAVLTDCDQDVLQIKAIPQGLGAACHTGRKSCFYREITADHRLVFTDNIRLFDPHKTYGHSAR